jgi:hypothetical protein
MGTFFREPPMGFIWQGKDGRSAVHLPELLGFPAICLDRLHTPLTHVTGLLSFRSVPLRYTPLQACVPGHKRKGAYGIFKTAHLGNCNTFQTRLRAGLWPRPAPHFLHNQRITQKPTTLQQIYR